ncbi:MAG: outer membrane receptor protein involved in Fe transport [Cyclobacteriaceae bacterium]|jgi:outer membrane receptor protein involved in Fe transport
MPIKNAFIALLLAFVAFQVGAQNASITVTGRVVDHNSSKPLDFATVAIIQKGETAVIAGGVTDSDGLFSIKSTSSDIYVEVSFLGYTKLIVENLEIKGGVASMGTILLSPDQELLSEVTVTAAKSQTVFELDKRVFNVGQDLSNAGGTALDVLNNVPSVDVDIEGVISLRGNSSVQVLINGKPSVLVSGNTLGTITADMIEKVEVITNPSAKYDAEGTSGIINIVIKKEDRKGLNGSATLNVGSPLNHSAGLSMNKRTEKFNFFGQFGVGKRAQLTTSNGATLDRGSNNPRYLYNDGSGGRDEQFYNVILGTDYHINPLNEITLSGHYAYEIEDDYSLTTYERRELNNSLINSSFRDEVSEATNPKFQYDLSYKKTFSDNKDRSLTFSAIGSSFAKDKLSNFKNAGVFGDFVGFEQRVANDYGHAEYSFQGDYVHPFSKSSELEAGVKYVILDIFNDFQLSNLENDQWIIDQDLNNSFDFDQKVLGAYTTYGFEANKFGLKMGLRMESTVLNTLLANTNEAGRQDYSNVFPSVHSSYNVSDQFSIQMGYSKRISRPRNWDLNPFPSFKDNLNLSMGNPNLLPEFTDSFEVNAIQTWDFGTLSGAVYHRQTEGVIERIVTVQDSLTIRMPMNLGQSKTTGLELNGSFDPAKWFTVLVDANWSSFNRTGILESKSFDFSNTSWSTELTTKFKLPSDIDMEMRANYRSAVEGVQGTSRHILYADFGIKKKFLKGRAVVNFSIRDVFKSRKYISEADLVDFYRYSESIRNGQQMVLGLSYGFGKGDAMEFSGQKQF